MVQKLTREYVVRTIRRLHSEDRPLSLTAVKRRHPDLIQFAFSCTPFWGWKQALADAGFQYADIRVQLTDIVRCRLCRFESEALLGHIIGQHAVSPGEYRHEFPGAELTSETCRAAMMGRIAGKKSKRILPHWERVWSAEYVLDRVFSIHRMGKRLNQRAILRAEPSLMLQARKRFGTWDEVLRRIGMDPLKVMIRIPRDSWTRPIVCAELRQLYLAGKSMRQSDLQATGHRPLCRAAVRQFDSYKAALSAAGIDPAIVVYKTPALYDERAKLGLLTAIRQAVAIPELHERDQAVRKLRRDLSGVVAKFWGGGCWAQAAEAAGVNPKLVRPVQGRYPTIADVLAGIRSRRRAGRAVNQKALLQDDKDIPLYLSGKILLGSWSKALLSAGIDPKSVDLRGKHVR